MHSMRCRFFNLRLEALRSQKEHTEKLCPRIMWQISCYCFEKPCPNISSYNMYGLPCNSDNLARHDSEMTLRRIWDLKPCIRSGVCGDFSTVIIIVCRPTPTHDAAYKTKEGYSLVPVIPSPIPHQRITVSFS